MSLFIGINDTGMIFECEYKYRAHLVWPQPVMTKAKFVKSTDETLTPVNDSEYPHSYFREDSFDPVSRIRRGRFYITEVREDNWHVIPTPHFHITPSGSATSNGYIVVKLTGYAPHKPPLTTVASSQSLVILGSCTASAVWSIIGIETISTGEELVTLKARQSFGALPEIAWKKLPPDTRNNVQEALEKLADDYRRAGPESVIDRAREAVSNPPTGGRVLQ
ncbi:MAG: hypothetical protein PHW13_07355 [Methylococcales bacterium]|nr:hypothetical protein [Methylococcales bacterium]